MPGFKLNVLELLRREARRRTAAGNAGQNRNVLENKLTRRRQLLLRVLRLLQDSSRNETESYLRLSS